uniref:SMODS and SLOG-associating 2TM effector domain-containing protein n=1 Tax=Candidatus Kentrum sp. LPFa TaxID=2126335 RepID=A0A450WFV6_9GAMM|nr:MAG: hypothetical protein BECKLPF1236A_GA0070988_101375 [Candidatus Kentron sp. LPFa]VFK31419.1 MAG: hypothetical protein BECKLPF1236C_GA0070990_101385 [Candidatus Kentron sp. LPFa]
MALGNINGIRKMGSEDANSTLRNPNQGSNARLAFAEDSKGDIRRCGERQNGGDSEPKETAAAEEEIDAFVFNCDRISIYHAIRRDFLDKCHRISLFLVVLSGTAAVADLKIQFGINWLTMFPALFGLANLVFDFAGQARIHESIYRRICALRGEIVADENVARNITRWQKEMHGIYAEDPAIYRALEAWAYNLACNGREQYEYHFIIPRWHLFLKNVWPFLSVNYAAKQL